MRGPRHTVLRKLPQPTPRRSQQTPKSHSQSHLQGQVHLCKRARSVGDEQLLGGGAAVREREFEVLGDQLLDVWSLDVVGVGDFDNLEDLFWQFR